MHTIQLRGPWEAKVLSRDAPSAEVGSTQSQPDTEWHRVAWGEWSNWLGRDFRGEVRFQRRFGRPTGIWPNTKVELVIESVDWRTRISLNDRFLGSCHGAEAPWQRDITHLLLVKNRLTLEIDLHDWHSSDVRQRLGERQGEAADILGPVYLALHDSV